MTDEKGRMRMSNVIVIRADAPVESVSIDPMLDIRESTQEPETFDVNTFLGHRRLTKGELVKLAAALLDLADMPCDFEGNLGAMHDLRFTRRDRVGGR